FCRVSQNPLPFIRKRQVYTGRDLFADLGMLRNLLPDRFHRSMRAQNAVGERLVLTQQSQKQMLRFDKGLTKLAGLIAREEDHTTGLFCVSLEHWQVLPKTLSRYSPKRSR